MIPILAAPLALFGLLAVPALVAIYFFHNRRRTREVSSLLLWAAVGAISEGGRTRERIRPPRTFWVELLILLLLIAAATSPLIPRTTSKRELVVVLDDSLSMRAGGAETPLSRGRSVVEQEISGRRFDPIRFILAGEKPQVAASLEGWTASSPAGDIDAALALARQLGGKRSQILVVTDHAPADIPAKGQIRWIATGQATPNVAFVTATRSTAERDRLLLEVQNYGPGPVSTTLTLSAADTVLRRLDLSLEGAALRRLQLELPPGIGAITARLGDDEAPFDNAVTLLPEIRRPVRVMVAIGEPALRDLVVRALEATGRVLVTSEGAELLVTDGSGGDAPWIFRIRHGVEKPSAFIGPFVVDRGHPLAQGLALDGVVWSASRSVGEGRPVVLAGAVPLLIDEESDRRRTIELRFDAPLSNLQKSPNWPALFSNLIEWRAATLPGIRTPNVSIGTQVHAAVASEAPAAIVVEPAGRRRNVAVADGGVTVRAAAPGIWRIRVADGEYSFAANPIGSGESNLARAASGTWGGWSEDSLLAAGHQSIGWLLGLIALGGLLVHQRLTAVEARA